MKLANLLLGAAIAGNIYAGSDISILDQLRAKQAVREVVAKHRALDDAMTEEKMREAWLSGDLEEKVKIPTRRTPATKKPSMQQHITHYSIEGIDDTLHAILKDNNGRTRQVQRRDLYRILRAYMTEEDTQEEKEHYYKEHFGKVIEAKQAFATAPSNHIWSKILDSTSELDAPYRAFLRAISIVESAAGRDASETGGCVGIWQIAPATYKDIQELNPALRQYQFSQVTGVRNVQLQARAAYTYVKELERYTRTTVQEHPGIIAAAYNAGPGVTRTWDRRTPFSEARKDICSAENMKRVLRMGYVKAQITEEYGMLVEELYRQFLDESVAE